MPSLKGMPSLKKQLLEKIDGLKEENRTVLHLSRYDRERKKVLDKNSPLIESLTKQIKEIERDEIGKQPKERGMNKQPDEMMLCKLNVLLMPNGEILCLGKSIGWFKNFQKELTAVSDATGKPVTEEV